MSRRDEEEDPVRVRLAPCPGCGSRKERCPCDALGDEFAASLGERLPDAKDVGRPKGGHLTDKARGGKQRQLQALYHAQGGEIVRVGSAVEAAAPGGHALRHFRDHVAARLEALKLGTAKNAEEIMKRTEQLAILDRMFDGEGMDQEEIGRALGHGRQWANKRVSEIRNEAAAPASLRSVAPRCRWCGREIKPRIQDGEGLRAGRRREYCERPRHCRERAYEERAAGQNEGRMAAQGARIRAKRRAISRRTTRRA